MGSAPAVQQRCRSSAILRLSQRCSHLLNARWRRRCSRFGMKSPLRSQTNFLATLLALLQSLGTDREGSALPPSPPSPRPSVRADSLGDLSSKAAWWSVVVDTTIATTDRRNLQSRHGPQNELVEVWDRERCEAVIWCVEKTHRDQLRTSWCYLRRLSSHGLGHVCSLLGIRSEPRHGSEVGTLEFRGTVQSDAEERGVEFGLVDRRRMLKVREFDSVALSEKPNRISQLLQEVRVATSDAHGEVQRFV
jgi:hypothetical protein